MAGYEAAATFDPYMVDGEEDEKSASVKEEPEDEWTWDSNEWWSWEGWEWVKEEESDEVEKVDKKEDQLPPPPPPPPPPSESSRSASSSRWHDGRDGKGKGFSGKGKQRQHRGGHGYYSYNAWGQPIYIDSYGREQPFFGMIGTIFGPVLSSHCSHRTSLTWQTRYNHIEFSKEIYRSSQTMIRKLEFVKKYVCSTFDKHLNKEYIDDE